MGPLWLSQFVEDSLDHLFDKLSKIFLQRNTLSSPRFSGTPNLTIFGAAKYAPKILILIINRGDPDPLQVQILSFLYHFIGHCEAKEKKAWLHIVPVLPPSPHDGPGKQWGRENPEQSASITPPPPSPVKISGAAQHTTLPQCCKDPTPTQARRRASRNARTQQFYS